LITFTILQNYVDTKRSKGTNRPVHMIHLEGKKEKGHK
jgi:hypothetical protein